MLSSFGIIPALPIFPTRHRSHLQDEMFLAGIPCAGRMSPREHGS